jgi:anti-sigma factor RsiW
MNCEEYRQSLAADPAFSGGDEHVADCGACQEFRRRIRALNVDIARALQIDVPPLDMPELERAGDDNVAQLPTPPRSHKLLWFALAATVVLAASISVRMTGVFQSYETLGEEVLAHIEHEPAALRVTAAPVPDGRLQRVVSAEYAVFDRDAALITYANPCKIDGKPAPHLVIQGEHGPVTVLLMPEHQVTEETLLAGEGMRGVIVPVGNGSIAIVGDSRERLDPIRQNVMNSITWAS